MKKGLLSLLAVTLTMVGCQDYDDQFAELTGLVNDLSTEVAGLSTVNASVAALSTTVNGLSSAIAAIPTTDSTAALTALTTALTAAQADIDAIEALLANVTTADELAAVSAALAAVQADVTTLLEADAVINQNVVINNSATLEYVESLISSAVDDPNVIVNGSVTINTTTFTPAITAAQLAKVNAIAAKLATVLGAGGESTDGVIVTSATPITFTNLSFIDDDYTISGADMDDAALRTVSGNLSASHGGAAVAFDYSQLASVGGNLVIAAADAATATSINLSGVVITGTFAEAGQAPGNLTFEGATTVDLGTAGFHKLTAAKASSIVSGMTTTGSLTITALNGGTIDVNSLATISAGDLAITGTSTSVFHFDALTTITGGGVDGDNGAGEIHLGALTAAEASLFDATTAVALTSLVTITNNIGLADTPAVIFTALKEVDANLTWNVGVINLPNANIDAGTIISSAATDVTVKAIDAITDIRAGEDVTKLVLTGQDLDLGATGDVTNLTVTADGAGIDVAAAGAVLTDVSLSGTEVNSFAATLVVLKNITLNDTATNTLTNGTGTVTQTVNLTGTILSFSSDATTLAALNNTATFKDTAAVTGETPISLTITDSALTSLDLSSMEKVAKVTITGNTGLTSLIAPTGASNLLTAGANASFTITGNSLVATYTNATAAFAGDGINPATPYAESCIYSPSLATWQAYIAQVYTTNTTVTYSLDYASSTDGNADFADDVADDGDAAHTPAWADTIDTAAELAAISATACGS